MSRVVCYIGENSGRSVLTHNVGQQIYNSKFLQDDSVAIDTIWDDCWHDPDSSSSFVYEPNGNVKMVASPHLSPVVNKIVDGKFKNTEFHTLRAVIGENKRFSLLHIRNSSPKKITLACCGGPTLIIGLRDDGFIIASNLSDILCHTKEYHVLQDKQIAILSREGVRFFTMEGRPIRRIVYGLQEEELSLLAVTIGSRIFHEFPSVQYGT